MINSTSTRFKVHDIHLLSIRNMLSVADVMAEHELCIKYGVEEIEELFATDYDEIVEEICKHIGKKRNK